VKSDRIVSIEVYDILPRVLTKVVTMSYGRRHDKFRVLDITLRFGVVSHCFVSFVREESQRQRLKLRPSTSLFYKKEN